MPMTQSLGQLTTGELTSLQAATQCILAHRGLTDPIVYVKIETLQADLAAESEDRAEAERNGKTRAQAS